MTLSETAAWGWLNTRVMTALGAISYPCYLYHGWGFAVGSHLVRHGPAWLLFVAGYLATLALATCSYRIVERPALALRARITRRPPSMFLRLGETGEAP
jgi:peptidoglycan/LPS O-acetylase OafA/YrhL